MMNVKVWDALEQSLNLVTLLEGACCGMDAAEAAGMCLVLSEIEDRLEVVREGIDAQNNTEETAEGYAGIGQ